MGTHYWQWANPEDPFSEKALFAHPADVQGWPQVVETSRKVAVIGGGVAGLTAAYELKRSGYRVTVFEASRRLGGRILTARFGDGEAYAELGAMRIPYKHRCTKYYVDLFELPIRDFVHANTNAFFHLRGEKHRQKDWRAYQRDGVYKLGDDFEWVWNQPPADVISSGLRAFADANPIDGWEIFSDELESPAARLLDDLSIWQFFCSRTVRVGEDVADVLPRLPSETWEYVGRASGLMWDEKGSCLEAMVDEISLLDPRKFEIEGGMELLVDGFVDRLPGVIRSNAPVVKVSIEGDSVSVTWLRPHGRRDSEEFSYVVCAAPADATARIDFEPALQAGKYEALTNLSYQSSAKALVYCRSRPWEYKDKIFGGGSHSDLPLQQTWYPSDNAIAADVQTSRVSQGGRARGTKAEPGTWRARYVDTSRKPGVVTAAYLWGTNARRFASLSMREREDVIFRNLERLHPGIMKVIDDFAFHAWDSETTPGGGAFAFFGPGEHQRYQLALTAPHGRDGAAPRVFFAGEHLAIFHAWIQSAIQTALAAVIAIQRQDLGY
jgi:monoamine oxidase